MQIISGLARGIDGVSQRGALMGRGKTFAVLGSGADVCYDRHVRSEKFCGKSRKQNI